MRAFGRWCLGGAVLLAVGSCGGDDDNDRIARDLAIAAATDAVAALGLDTDLVVGEPRTQPCLDGFGRATDRRLANFSVALDSIDDRALDRLSEGRPDGLLQDSRDGDTRLVVWAERREGVLVTLRVQTADERSDLGVTVDCVG